MTQYSVDGEVSDDILDKIEEHIAKCDDCYSFFQTQTNLLERLTESDAKELVEDHIKKLVATRYQMLSGGA